MASTDNSLLLHLFLHVGKILMDRVRRDLDRIGVHHGQGRVLSALARQGTLSQAEIAAGLHIRPATVSRMLEAMQAAGLVARSSEPGDERVHRISLTRKGRSAAVQVEKVWRSLEGELLGVLTPAQAAEARRMLLAVRSGYGERGPEFRRKAAPRSGK